MASALWPPLAVRRSYSASASTIESVGSDTASTVTDSAGGTAASGRRQVPSVLKIRFGVTPDDAARAELDLRAFFSDFSVEAVKIGISKTSGLVGFGLVALSSPDEAR